MKFIKGNFKVEWNWVGEGFNGDYNPHKLVEQQTKDGKVHVQDKPLLRFYCYKRFGRQWEEIWETSFCTHVVRGTHREVLQTLTDPIFNALENNVVLDVGGDTPEFEASGALIHRLQALSLLEAK